MDVLLNWIDNSEGLGTYSIYRSTSPLVVGALPEPLDIEITEYEHKSTLILSEGGSATDPDGGSIERWMVARDIIPVGIKHYYMVAVSDHNGPVFGDQITFGEDTPLEPIILRTTGAKPFRYSIKGGSGTIDYGDGTVEPLVADVTGKKYTSHSYDVVSDYTVTIQLDTPTELLSVDTDELVSWGGGYYRITIRNPTMILPVTFSPYLTSTENMLEGWAGTTDITTWDVSKVTDMDRMFYNSPTFNQQLDGWDISKVWWFNNTFNTATSFQSNLATWDVSNAVCMDGMFAKANAFDSQLGTWSVGNTRSMEGMFGYNTKFNRNLSGWCVSQYTKEPLKFSMGATQWTQPQPIWGTCPTDGPIEPEIELPKPGTPAIKRERLSAIYPAPYMVAFKQIDQ